jgi:hypothetical protein
VLYKYLVSVKGIERRDKDDLIATVEKCLERATECSECSGSNHDRFGWIVYIDLRELIVIDSFSRDTLEKKRNAFVRYIRVETRTISTLFKSLLIGFNRFYFYTATFDVAQALSQIDGMIFSTQISETADI